MLEIRHTILLCKDIWVSLKQLIGRHTGIRRVSLECRDSRRKWKLLSLWDPEQTFLESSHQNPTAASTALESFNELLAYSSTYKPQAFEKERLYYLYNLQKTSHFEKPPLLQRSPICAVENRLLAYQDLEGNFPTWGQSIWTHKYYNPYYWDPKEIPKSILLNSGQVVIGMIQAFT